MADQLSKEMESTVHMIAGLCMLLAQGESSVTPESEGGHGRLPQKQEKFREEEEIEARGNYHS